MLRTMLWTMVWTAKRNALNIFGQQTVLGLGNQQLERPANVPLFPVSALRIRPPCHQRVTGARRWSAK